MVSGAPSVVGGCGAALYRVGEAERGAGTKPNDAAKESEAA